MNPVAWLGLILILLSYGQAFAPRQIFDEPAYAVFGYPFLPANVLALSMSLFALGVIMLSEGVCRRFDGVSLCAWAIATPQRLLRVALSAAAGGLALEVVAQWLGKLWFYPYWTTWFYWLTLLPGYAFYWLAIVESYLAAKAVLDRVLTRGGHVARPFPVPYGALGFCGLAALAGAAWLFARWIAGHGWSFAVARSAPEAPPFGYGLLAFLGAWLVIEWLLYRRGGAPSLVDSVARGYRAPVLAVLATSAVVGLAMETQNNPHNFWRYTHFPAPEATVAGVQATVLATWPLQYLVFLLVATVLTPALASLFFSPTRG